MPRDGEVEGTALFRLAFHPYAPLMEFDQLFDYGEAKSQTQVATGD